MLTAKVWHRLLGVERIVVEEVEFDAEAEVLVAHVRPRKGARRRCGRCGRRAPGFDQGEGRRRWRALDLGVVQVLLEADAPRVCCPEHGPTVVAVPWARHQVGHTYAFDDQVAWLAVRTSKTAVQALMRIAWRTVGAICARVAADAQAGVDRWADLRRIGIDEISYKRGHTAPRGALSYTQLSWEELGGSFLGLMPNLDPKGNIGNSSMAVKQRTSRRRRRWAAVRPVRHGESWIA